MAEIAVQSAIQLIEGEISLIAGLEEDVSAIKDKLERISAFLESVEDKVVRDAEKSTLVKQVRILAYEIEDVIEEYRLFCNKGFIDRVQDYMLFRVRNMAVTIKSIHKKTVEINNAIAFRFNINKNDVTSSSQYTQTTTPTMTFVQESELVGFKIPKREIIQLLCLHKLVAIVGMRGLGKTTIARSVYNDPRVRNRFHICAWISARRTRDPKGILRSMMNQFYEADHEGNRVTNIDSKDLNSLQIFVRSYIKDKRYLLVVDNVKEDYLEKVNYIKSLLSANNNNDSKILVTSRDHNVARDCVGGSSQSIYQLRCLPDQESWELFCKKTFQNNQERSCPPFLKELAIGIVKKCQGLPPAILAMSRLLSTKSIDVHEWKKVHDSLGFYIEKNYLRGVHEILIGNYNDLSYNLKPCFLYFGLFPIGDPIDIMKLVRLWIAEGLVTRDRSLTLEESAKEILDELISMNLVTIGNKDIAGSPKTLIIHEFLHQLILSKGHELNFCQILSDNNSTCDDPRRLSIQRVSNEYNARVCLDRIANSKSNVRSLFIFQPIQGDTSNNPSLFISSMVLQTKFLNNVHLLKVLDLCGAPINDIPSQIGELRNLRYLSLRQTSIRTLPKYIRKLQELQTLDLKQTQILELPYEINELHKLRHLLIYRYKPDFSLSFHTQKIIGTKLPNEALGNFKELQKLAFVDMSHHGNSVTTYLKSLTQLRRLGITGLKKKYEKDFCAAIQVMTCLQALNVHSIDNKSEKINLNHIDPPPSTLKHLYINGLLASFPNWILKLDNLVKLRLRWSNINDDFDLVGKLHTLLNLVELQLLEAYKGIFLEFKNEGFKRLKVLQLLDLHDLESLLIHEGALPLLENFSIGVSEKLQIPSGIKHLRRLKVLNFYDMPKSFNDSMQCCMEHYSIVQHIPEVLFHLKNTLGHWEIYTLRRS